MVNAPRNGQRAGAMSFDNRQFYGATPTTGDIVSDSTAARTGAGGLHATIQSGVASTVQLPTIFPASTTIGYFRFYARFVSLPSSSRVFAAQSSVITGRLNLRMTSGGQIELRYGTTTLATTASVYTTGQWILIELGVDSTNAQAKLRVNENTEIEWMAAGGSVALSATISFGCSDTVAAAFEFYIDDVVWDSRDFPGPGRVKMAKMFDVVTDNANFVLTGSTKPAALDPGTTFDDTTFLTVAVTNSSITFGLDTIPSDIVVIYGITPFFRYQRSAAANSIIEARVGWRGGGTESAITFTSDTMSVVSAFTVSTVAGLSWSSVFGGFFPPDFHNELTFGITTASANGAKITAMWVEIDYSDVAGDIPMERTLQLASFEESTIAEFISTNRATTGTVQLTSSWSKFGAEALELVHASGGASRLRFQLDDFQSAFPTALKACTMETWIQIPALPSSGNMGLLAFVDSATTRITLNVNNSGQLSVNIDGNSSSAAGTLVVNTEYHIAMEMYLPSSGASNCRVKIWVDDILVITYSNTNATLTFGSSAVFQLGTTANVTGGGTVRYDGLIIDGSIRHGRYLKFAMLVPTGAGATTAAGFTASTGSKFSCIDEFPDNGDTDYVLLATGLGTTTLEMYAATDAPADSIYFVPLVQAIITVKRDAATNGQCRSLIRLTANGVTFSNSGGLITSGAAYASTAQFVRDLSPHGILTPTRISALEVGVQQTSNTIATRVTNLGLLVAYRAANAYPPLNRQRVSWVG